MKPAIAIPATAALVYRAWSRKSLTPVGILTAFLTAVAHAVHPWSVFFALLTVFFLAGTAVKHNVKATLTQSATGASGGEGPRNHIQVLANSLIASVLILLHTWQLHKEGTYWNEDLCWKSGGDVIVIGIVANYAAVAADTFSSELGILSTSKPRLITAPWRVVPPGTNGGVTMAGLIAGWAGASLIAGTSVLLLPFCKTWSPADKAIFTYAISAAGFAGTLLDSLLGALFQASVVDVHSGKIVEGAGGRKVMIHSTIPHSKLTLEAESGKSSGVETTNVQATRTQKAGGSGSDVAEGYHESRKVEVGHDILDNNAVNIAMAGIALRFVPQKAHPTSTTLETSAPSAPGVHDALRSRLSLTSPAPSNTTTSSSPAQLQSTHPLEARLANWRATQDALKMTMLRRQFGIAEPVRRGMELKIAREGEWRPAALGGAAGVHRDILEGRDAEIGWEDVFTGQEMRQVPDFHTEMEGRLRMNW
ncbi:UMP1-domain-containing protein [Aaosphaeria arxii CBS 175.79]|uniref:UMP1-domain-containing protein n=1 Tax=Aaosphaeria arxii CBS 175.79 TaxID=1450172 RepID=A0A6A5Y071_9PLEO|nr:UMP1-domain-containing protein [Aaosphaeria arxii CBS 175.79]KAF2018616.1 UMP1-domain-containing protein [Aaosphaeria arxii CBS 175.79]